MTRDEFISNETRSRHLGKVDGELLGLCKGRVLDAVVLAAVMDRGEMSARQLAEYFNLHIKSTQIVPVMARLRKLGFITSRREAWVEAGQQVRSQLLYIVPGGTR